MNTTWGSLWRLSKFHFDSAIILWLTSRTEVGVSIGFFRFDPDTDSDPDSDGNQTAALTTATDHNYLNYPQNPPLINDGGETDEDTHNRTF